MGAKLRDRGPGAAVQGRCFAARKLLARSLRAVNEVVGLDAVAPRTIAPSTLMRGVGMAALAACVLASSWLALGAADSRYLLELPTSTSPHWIAGPLLAVSGLVGTLDPNALSTALVILGAGYLLALACAERIPLRAALIAIVLANAAFTLGPTIVSTDVFGYIAYARELAAHGLDPYVSAPISLGHDSLLRFVYWKHQPSPYGPLFTAASAPLGLLSASAALWLFKAAAGIACILTALMVARLAERRELNPSRAAILVGLNPVLLFYAVSGAHNDLLAVALMVGAIGLMLRGEDSWAGALAVVAAAVKLTVGLALPFVLLGAARRWRAARGAALAIVVIGVPSLALFGPDLFSQLHRISTDRLFDTVFSGPDRVATVLGTHITSAIRAICTGLALVVALATLVWVRRGADAITAAGWAFLALIASIASLAPWYLAWLMPLAALGRSRRLRVASLLATAYLILVHLPALGGEPWLSQAGASAHSNASQIALVGPASVRRSTATWWLLQDL
jgi:hypothetical protein